MRYCPFDSGSKRLVDQKVHGAAAIQSIAGRSWSARLTTPPWLISELNWFVKRQQKAFGRSKSPKACEHKCDHAKMAPTHVIHWRCAPCLAILAVLLPTLPLPETLLLDSSLLDNSLESHGKGSIDITHDQRTSWYKPMPYYPPNNHPPRIHKVQTRQNKVYRHCFLPHNASQVWDRHSGIIHRKDGNKTAYPARNAMKFKAESPKRRSVRSSHRSLMSGKSICMFSRWFAI